MAQHQNLPNPVLDPAPFGRWTQRDKAAKRRLAQTLGVAKVRDPSQVVIHNVKQTSFTNKISL
jgi:hypothetical protein